MTKTVVIRETWLSRKPDSLAALMIALLTFSMSIVSVLYWSDYAGWSSLMPASHESVLIQKEYWRAWTTLFVHGDQKHLLSNSFLFFILGAFLAGYFGRILIPLTALFFGGVINFIVLAKMPAEIKLIGASGVVFWMGGAWLTLYFLLDRRRTIYQRALRSLGVGIVMFVPAETFAANVSYRSHFVGFLLGMMWALAFYAWKRKKFLAAEVHETVIEEELNVQI